jgi:hypothetical protein
MKLFSPAVLAGTFIVATVFLTGWLFNDHAAEQLKTSTAFTSPGVVAGATQAEVEQLRRQLAALQVQLAAVSASAATRSATPVSRVAASPNAAVDGPSESAEVRRAAERAEGERLLAEHIAGIAAAFDREVRDVRWSNATSSLLQAALTSAEPRALAPRSIDCRNRTCRVELEDTPAGAVSEALPLLGLRLAEVLPNIIVDRGSREAGRGTLVLYLSAPAQG